MKKIKIALCYSGAVRGLINNLPQVRKVLFSDPEVEYDVDYYLYADPKGASIHSEDIQLGDQEPQGLKVQQELDYFKCLFEDETGEDHNLRMTEFGTRIRNYHMPYKEQVLQWYAVKRVFDFVFDQEETYDVYVRLRCDIFPAGRLKFDWNQFDQNTVYVPFNCPFGGINDRFAFGSASTMRKYANFYGTDIYYDGDDVGLEVKTRAQAWYDLNYDHIPTDNYGGGSNNSEYRMLNHLLSEGLNIELLQGPPDGTIICSPRNAAGIIRYSGPDLEEMLLRYEDATLDELKYDRKWW